MTKRCLTPALSRCSGTALTRPGARVVAWLEGGCSLWTVLGLSCWRPGLGARLAAWRRLASTTTSLMLAVSVLPPLARPLIM